MMRPNTSRKIVALCDTVGRILASFDG